MQLPERIIQQLTSRNEIWDAAPGLTGMRGSLASLRREVSRIVGETAAQLSDDEWKMPHGLSFETLERAGYFESFPQWLSGASHLSGDDTVLERVATSLSPGDTARQSFEPATAALPPAVCYHTYAALRGKVITERVTMTAEEVCWRHERDRFSKLERGWAFTMREAVCLSSSELVEAFRQSGIEKAIALAESLGLSTRVEVASDPFFAPTSRGKALLQRFKSLKHELLFDYPDGRSLAIASFNNHELFFGDSFDITLEDGSAASSACVAFGIERWMLAILMTHGVERGDWPVALTRECATAGGIE
jgi:seryl-tRNA synthetase